MIPVYGLKFSFNDSFKAVVAGPARKTLRLHVATRYRDLRKEAFE